MAESAHVHMTWLFLNCSFPDSQAPGSDDHGRDIRLPPTVTAHVASHGSLFVPAFRPELSLPINVPGKLPTLYALETASCQTMPPDGLLCDTARRERSGVQLV